MCTWKNNPDLMSRLEKVQNNPAFAHQDITSLAGMCSNREELERHVVRCEKRAGVEPEPAIDPFLAKFYANRPDILEGFKALARGERISALEALRRVS
jgi:hypothetical protein